MSMVTRTDSETEVRRSWSRTQSGERVHVNVKERSNPAEDLNKYRVVYSALYTA